MKARLARLRALATVGSMLIAGGSPIVCYTPSQWAQRINVVPWWSAFGKGVQVVCVFQVCNREGQLCKELAIDGIGTMYVRPTGGFTP